MRFIFDSQLYPESLLLELKAKSKGSLDYAAHNLCKAFYNGLLNNQQQVSLVNIPNLGSFPFLYKVPKVKGAKLENGYSIPFWNLTYFKRFDIRRRLYQHISALLKEHGTKDTVLLLYDYRCLPFIKRLKESFPGLKVCMIVTDLPEFMMAPPSRLLNVLNSIFNLQKESDKIYLDLIDGFVLLSPKMQDRLSIPGKSWVQIEGIYNNDTHIAHFEKERCKTILYTGDLGKRYGIINLVEAFHGISDVNYRLWLCGDGDGKDEILQYARKDQRIQYKGILPRKEILELQAKATVLVNPRKSDDEYTKYSFPSKTMEYLASGTPVIMSHLASIPEEYDRHIYYLDDESIEGIRKKIIEICNKPQSELNEFGLKASEFIYKNKTEKTQVKKMLDMISTL